MTIFCGAAAQLAARLPHRWGLHLTNNYINTLDRTPLNKCSTRHRGRYLHNTQKTQETNIHALSGIQTRDSSNQAVSELRLTPRRHRQQHSTVNW